MALGRFQQARQPRTRLGEIGFVEFTSRLITSVFDAVIDAHVQQTEAYMALLNSVSQSLQEYVNNTKDDIALADVSAFLSVVSELPADQLKILTGESPVPASNAPDLNPAALTKLNTLIALPAAANLTNAIAANTKLDTVGVKSIRDAIAGRIAANRYTLLQEMVRLGILRLIVDHGVVETKMTFNTYQRASNVNRDSRFAGSTDTFGAGAGLVGAPGPAAVGGGFASSSTDISVSTASNVHRDASGSSTNVFGRVEIHFKTDFAPLNPNP